MTSAPDTIIHGVRIFDGEATIAGADVLLSGGRIAELSDRVAVPAGAEVVDGRGRTLLPGLIDCHVHARPESLEQALAFGVTSELDMFSMPALAGTLRRVAAERCDVCDIRSAGLGGAVTNPFLPGVVPTLTSPAEATDFVTGRVADGSDYIKVYLIDAAWNGGRPIDGETLGALLAETHARGRLALVHADSSAAARTFIEAGGDALAHVLGDLELDQALLDRLRRPGVFVVPTLRVSALFSAERGEATDAERAAMLDHPRLGRHLDAGTRAIMTDRELLDDARERNLRQRDGHGHSRLDHAAALRATAALHRSGVTVLAGTDVSAGAASPRAPLVRGLAGHGIALHHELLLLVEAGLTPAEALAAATSHAARCFGLKDRGRVAPGLRADLLLVDGDPTRDIRATWEIAAVWRDGARLDRERPPG
ncbi:MAG TPA: amidohydrolase family protein [Candidatus Dormibacteraeota bacterium]|nr:amidohydrolase family protein [Candidatus Dormibacteraeota bacterium]